MNTNESKALVALKSVVDGWIVSGGLREEWSRLRIEDAKEAIAALKSQPVAGQVIGEVMKSIKADLKEALSVDDKKHFERQIRSALWTAEETLRTVQQPQPPAVEVPSVEELRDFLEKTENDWICADEDGLDGLDEYGSYDTEDEKIFTAIKLHALLTSKGGR